VVATYGRQCLVQLPGVHTTVHAVQKGRDLEPVVGDRVELQDISADQAVIAAIGPRHNQFLRSQARKQRILAANIDQMAIVLSAQPVFSEELLMRMMMSAHEQGIEVGLIANKQDLDEAWRPYRPRLDVYRQLGYRVFELSIKHQPTEARTQLLGWMQFRTTLLAGQSGMGKSTLVNLLVPQAGQLTQAISLALGTGKHTTTFARAFLCSDELEMNPASRDETWLIDTPGFQQFGLFHLSASQRFAAMPEYQQLARCKYYNCQHLHEPGCEVRAAVQAGLADAQRYQLFTQLEQAESAG
jgi:ribosome biogenesis GTPase / thiamine phosphate phosphatase